jgi:hypothetical protein
MFALDVRGVRDRADRSLFVRCSQGLCDWLRDGQGFIDRDRLIQVAHAAANLRGDFVDAETRAGREGNNVSRDYTGAAPAGKGFLPA